MQTQSTMSGSNWRQLRHGGRLPLPGEDRGQTATEEAKQEEMPQVTPSARTSPSAHPAYFRNQQTQVTKTNLQLHEDSLTRTKAKSETAKNMCVHHHGWYA